VSKTSISGCRSLSQSTGVIFFALGEPQICRRNCSDICHTVGDISTSSLDGQIAISGYLPMSLLFVDTFFEFGVVDNFVYRARITVILTSDLLGCKTALEGIFTPRCRHNWVKRILKIGQTLAKI